MMHTLLSTERGGNTGRNCRPPGLPAGMAGEKQAEKVIFGGVTDPYPIYVKKTTADAVWFLF